MKVVTVLKSGGEFGPQDVINLKAMIDKFNIVDFYCLSDIEIPGVTTIPLKNNWPGWWSKIELFNIGSNEVQLYMDLDTVITGNFEHFFYEDVDFAPLHDAFQRLKGNIRMGSGLFLYRPNAMRFIYDDFKQKSDRVMTNHKSHGDQRYIESKINLNNHYFIQNLFPEQIFSYKGDLCENKQDKGFKGIPEDARIIFFHGKPRPKEKGYLGII